MKVKLLSVTAALCLSFLVSARPGFSQQLQPLQNDPPLVSQMLQEGWEKVADGVLQREGGGKVETFTYGEEGLRWTARKLEARLELLQKEYDQYPSANLARALENLKTQLIDVDQSLDGGVGQAEMPSSEELDSCTISYDALAAADPLTYPQAPGTTASASANYSSNCGQLGNSYAYAYARATAGTVTTTKTQEDPKYNSTSVASAASVSSPGSLDCYSEAFARAWSPTLNINYEVSDYNYTCPNSPPPFSVSISGPYNVYLSDYYPCETVTWTATPSGGTPGYSYAWYIDGYYYGTGQSVSQTYCQTNQGVNVSVYASDSGGQSASNSFTTWISYQSSCSSNCGCAPPNYREPYYDQPYICP